MEGNANRLRISNLQSKEPHQTGDGDDADGGGDDDGDGDGDGDDDGDDGHDADQLYELNYQTNIKSCPENNFK